MAYEPHCVTVWRNIGAMCGGRDPAARWTGPAADKHSSPIPTNYLIDVDNGVIVDVEATTAIRQAEVLAAKSIIERSAQFLHGATLLH